MTEKVNDPMSCVVRVPLRTLDGQAFLVELAVPVALRLSRDLEETLDRWRADHDIGPDVPALADAVEEQERATRATH